LGLAKRAKAAGLDGWVAAPIYATPLRRLSDTMLVNVVNVRPAWSLTADENPLHIMTPANAFMLGADRIVVGGPIVDAADPHDAVMRTLDEIDKATSSSRD
jgi:orotidine-5'-phosphate decarboxylase